MSDNHLRIYVFATATILVGLSATVDARPCAQVPADYAFSEATLIVKGSVASTIPGTSPGADSTGMIRIERVLKGRTVLPVISVSYFLCGTEYSYALQQGRSIIAFIDASGRQLVGGTAVLAASNRSARALLEPKAALRAELLLAVRDANPKTARSAVGALAELDRQASVETLKQYADAKDFGTRFLLTWLTRFGEADAFDEVAGIVSEAPFSDGCPNTIRNDSDESLVTACDDLFKALRSFDERGFGGSTAPPRADMRFVDTMAMLAQSKNRAIHRAAIGALRGFKSRAAFPVLAAALDDPDENVRFDSMFTLCMAMNAPDVKCPGWVLFKQDEQQYIGRVRAWWNTQTP